MSIPSILQSPKVLAIVVAGLLAVGGLLFTVFGPGTVSGNARAELIKRHSLKGEEIAALDLCVRLMRGRTIRGGGDTATYCGCLAKQATEEMHEPYKTNAIQVANVMIRSGSIRPADAVYHLPNDSFTGLRKGAVMTIRTAIQQCASEARDTMYVRRKEERERLETETVRR